VVGRVVAGPVGLAIALANVMAVAGAVLGLCSGNVPLGRGLLRLCSTLIHSGLPRVLSSGQWCGWPGLAGRC
jgi:hypothetical protein